MRQITYKYKKANNCLYIHLCLQVTGISSVCTNAIDQTFEKFHSGFNAVLVPKAISCTCENFNCMVPNAIDRMQVFH